jgi:hypothetical protein
MMEEWQATYDWASRQAPETPMDGAWWWKAALMNITARTFRGTRGIISKNEIKAPQPEDQWKSDMLDELYVVLFPKQKLTVGQFKTVLEKVKPIVPPLS